MTLRFSFVFIVLSLVLGVISYFYITNISPFDEQMINELIQERQIAEDDFETLNFELRKIYNQGLIFEYLSPNAYVGFGLVSAALLFLFVACHIMLDKLFFKKFYEIPSFFDAFRRGLLIILSLGLIIYLRFLNLTWQEAIVVPIILLLLEILFMSFLKDDFMKSLGRKKT